MGHDGTWWDLPQVSLIFTAPKDHCQEQIHNSERDRCHHEEHDWSRPRAMFRKGHRNGTPLIASHDPGSAWFFPTGENKYCFKPWNSLVWQGMPLSLQGKEEPFPMILIQLPRICEKSVRHAANTVWKPRGQRSHWKYSILRCQQRTLPSVDRSFWNGPPLLFKKCIFCLSFSYIYTHCSIKYIVHICIIHVYKYYIYMYVYTHTLFIRTLFIHPYLIQICIPSSCLYVLSNDRFRVMLVVVLKAVPRPKRLQTCTVYLSISTCVNIGR